MCRAKRLRLIVATLLLSWNTTLSICLATDPEDSMLRQMLRLGLGDSAIVYVLEREALASGPLATDERAKWRVRLLEVYAQVALSDRQQAPDNWRRCEAAYEESFSGMQGPPDAAGSRRRPWIIWQFARCHFLRARGEATTYWAAPAVAERREDALRYIREALVTLKLAEDEIAARLPLAARQGLRDTAQAPAEQLRRLRVDVALLQCEALLLRSRLYDPNSRDRIAAATQADDLASEVLARVHQQWSSYEALSIAQAAARLQLGQAADALSALEEIARSGQTPATRTRAAAIAIDFLIERRQLSRARNLLPALETAGPEYLLVKLQLDLAELDDITAEDRDVAMQDIVKQAKQLGAEHGDYWRNRAEALLIGRAGASSLSSPNTVRDLALVEVRQLLAAGNIAAAADKLLSLRDQELVADNPEAGLRAASQAAALLQREEKWDDAIAAVAPIAHAHPEAQNAATAHLLAVMSHRSKLQADLTDRQALEDYEACLQDHLRLWPTDASSVQVAQSLQRLLLGQGKFSQLMPVMTDWAAAATTSLSPATSASSSAVESAMQIWLTTLLAEQPPDAQRRELARTEQLVRDGALPAGGVIEVAWLAGSLCTTWPPPADAERMIQRLADVESSSQPWSQLIVLLRVLDAVRLQDKPAVGSLTQQVDFRALGSQLQAPLARRIIEAIDFAPEQTHVAWGRLVGFDAALAEQLRATGGPTNEAVALRIDAFGDKLSAALAGLTELVERNLRDVYVQLQLAQLLAESGENRLAESSRFARRAAARSAAGSQLRLTAHWRLIRNLLRQGNAPEAQKAAKLVLATQAVSDPVWRERFEQLAKP